jgi:hypothetical protein
VSGLFDWSPEVGDGFEVSPACWRWQSLASPPEAPAFWPFWFGLLAAPAFPDPVAPEPLPEPLFDVPVPASPLAPLWLVPLPVPDPWPALPAVCAKAEVAIPIDNSAAAAIFRNITFLLGCQ